MLVMKLNIIRDKKESLCLFETQKGGKREGRKKRARREARAVRRGRTNY